MGCRRFPLTFRVLPFFVLAALLFVWRQHHFAIFRCNGLQYTVEALKMAVESDSTGHKTTVVTVRIIVRNPGHTPRLLDLNRLVAVVGKYPNIAIVPVSPPGESFATATIPPGKGMKYKAHLVFDYELSTRRERNLKTWRFFCAESAVTPAGTRP